MSRVKFDDEIRRDPLDWSKKIYPRNKIIRPSSVWTMHRAQYNRVVRTTTGYRGYNRPQNTLLFSSA